MTKFVAGLAATAVVCAAAYCADWRRRGNQRRQGAMQKATAECRAQVKDYAQYHETSWYQRHKMVKNCMKQPFAKH